MNANGNVRHAIITYNQETFIRADHERYMINGNKQYLAEAVKVAGYVIEKMSNNGLVPGNATSGDGGLYNRIFFRYFVRLINEPNLEHTVRENTLFADYTFAASPETGITAFFMIPTSPMTNVAGPNFRSELSISSMVTAFPV
jgi:hypothetical protein